MTVFSFFWTDWAAPPFNFKKYHFGIKLWNCYSVQVSRNVTAKSEQQLFFFCLFEHKSHDYTGSASYADLDC